MDKKLIDRYIALPMAINVLKQDRQEFKKFTMGPAYLALLDPAIEKATQDFYELKKDMISKHHVDIKRIGKLQYKVNGEIVEYTADEIKKLSEEIMNEYFGSVEIKEEVTPWGLLNGDEQYRRE